MGTHHSFFTIAIATLSLFTLPGAAHAIGFSTVSSETELNALLSQPAFVVKGQIGKNTLIKNDKTQSNIDVVWSQGETQPFSLSYDGLNVKYTVGEDTLSANSPGFFNDIFIDTKATEKNTSLLLSNLLLTDSNTSVSISGIAASYPKDEFNIFWIQGVQDNFTLTGNVMLNWLKPLQNPANLGYQISVGNANSLNTSSASEQNNTQPQPVESNKPGSETGKGIDWLSWLTNSESNYCVSP